MTKRPKHMRPGFSLVEAAVSVVVVSLLFSVALNTVGASRKRQALSIHQGRAQALAMQLMAEILCHPYEDPDDAVSALGIDASELLANFRSDFDDVDDYAGWDASPPTDREGQPLPGFDRSWRRTVEVVWVEPDDPDRTATLPTGVKRITVTVQRGGMRLARLTTLRSQGWVQPADAHGLEN